MRKIKWFYAIVLIAAMVVSGMPMKMIRNVTNVKADAEGESIYGMEVSPTVELPTTTEEKENGYYYGGEGRYEYEVLKDGTIKIVHFDLFIPADDPIADWAMIPSEINGKAVTCIGSGAFKEYGDLVEIVIPDSVTTIENDAFNDCKNLKKIVMSDSIISIGDRAFYNCKKLASIIVSLNTMIGEDAFVGCDNLEIEYKELTTEDTTKEELMTEAPTTEVLDVIEPTIEIDTTTHETITPIETTTETPTTSESKYGTEGEYGYEILDDGTIKITSYRRSIDPPGTVSIDWAVVPSQIAGRNVTVIGVGAFRDCCSVVDIIIPESVTTIESFAFTGSWALISIPSTVTKIGSFAFSGCGCLDIRGNTNLFGITIPERITEIEEGVFHNCTWLENVVIPSGVISIGNRAFEGCSALTSITIPDTVTSIGEKAFYNCTQLKEIKIPINTTIGKDAFAGCDNLKIEYIEPTTEDATTDELITQSPTTEVEPTTEDATTEETTKVVESTTEALKTTEPSTTIVTSTTTISPTTKELTVTTRNVSVGKTKVKKVTKKLLSKKAKISLKNISGAQYQVKVSATKKFKAKDSVTKKVTKATFTINNKKIKNKKVLYVKARAYKVVDGKTYYGNWSKVKRVKVKK